ncbi:hypothetical protein J3R74_002379 [Puniceicoccus vermicola]
MSSLPQQGNALSGLSIGGNPETQGAALGSRVDAPLAHWTPRSSRSLWKGQDVFTAMGAAEAAALLQREVDIFLQSQKAKPGNTRSLTRTAISCTNGAKPVSPGQRPGKPQPSPQSRALKGRNSQSLPELHTCRGRVTPFQGYPLGGDPESPGRCPGLSGGCTFDALDSATPEVLMERRRRFLRHGRS